MTKKNSGLQAKCWLQEEFRKRKADRPDYSQRQLAKHLTMSSGRLSELFTGKRRITPELAEKLAGKLGLSPRQRGDFFQAVMAERFSLSPTEAGDDAKCLDETALQGIADWHYFAILSLMETSNFDPRPSRIARRLGIPVAAVNRALEHLRRLKLIHRRTNRWALAHRRLTTSWDVPSAALRHSHRQELQRAIMQLDTVPIDARDVSALTMAIDIAQLPKAKKLIRQFQRLMESALEQGNRTEVYTLNIQLLPVTRRGT